MRTSAAGSSRGFTLLELLVTLAIIALVAALAAPAIAARLLDPPAAKSARLLKGLLEEARGAAAQAGRPVAVVWWPEGRRFALVETGDEEVSRESVPPRGGRTPAFEVPAQVEVTLQGFLPVRGGRWGAAGAEGILLFPLGGSTGGSVGLRAEGPVVTLQVDPLTGYVAYVGEV